FIGDEILHGDNGNDHIRGNAGDDKLYGGLGDDHIEGDDGDDIIDGGKGTNYLYGGNGNDYIRASAGSIPSVTVNDNNYIRGGLGDDIISIGNTNQTTVDVFSADLGHDIIYSNGDESNVTIKIEGGDINNLSFDWSGDDYMVDFNDGRSVEVHGIYLWQDLILRDWNINGSDYDILNLTGKDVIMVPDQIFGSPVSETLTADLSLASFMRGGHGDDTIYGSNLDDVIYGSDGNDTIYANDGNDIIFGNGSQDTVYGGLGDDIFSYDYTDFNSHSFGVDNIMDFSIVTGNNDAIDVSDILDGYYDPLTDNINQFISITNDNDNANIKHLSVHLNSSTWGSIADIHTNTIDPFDLQTLINNGNLIVEA
ncbi:MAG: hypothetical protein COB76_06470, partial [Alphaproteobacteria bacterium]